MKDCEVVKVRSNTRQSTPEICLMAIILIDVIAPWHRSLAVCRLPIALALVQELVLRFVYYGTSYSSTIVQYSSTSIQ